MIRIGNASGFWGDDEDAAARLIRQQPDLDFITFDYLAEVSLSIMAIQREKDPALGYAADFLYAIRSLVPFWKRGAHFKVISNAGGLNPEGLREEVRKIFQDEGLERLKIGVVSGDDVLPKKDLLSPNLETDAPIAAIADQLVTANAYLGAKPIVDCLHQGADVVITGRVADPSLTVAPCAYHYGWSFQDYERLAGATVAGHLIECGTQVTGGICTNWWDLPDPAHLGYPVVEVSEEGSFVVTKPPHTGGRVSIETVKEQLLYEIGDPEKYLSPDVTVSFLGLKLEEVGPDRIQITGALGQQPPDTFKVSATYREGYRVEGMLVITGRDAVKKAKRVGEIILERMKEAGFVLEKTLIECLGAGDVVPGVFPREDLRECVLRVAASDSRKEALEKFVKRFAPLVTSGPQGVTGYTNRRPIVRPIFGYWPCLIPVADVHPKVDVR
jgi:hypothetical protein